MAPVRIVVDRYVRPCDLPRPNHQLPTPFYADLRNAGGLAYRVVQGKPEFADMFPGVLKMDEFIVRDWIIVGYVHWPLNDDDDHPELPVVKDDTGAQASHLVVATVLRNPQGHVGVDKNGCIVFRLSTMCAYKNREIMDPVSHIKNNQQLARVHIYDWGMIDRRDGLGIVDAYRATLYAAWEAFLENEHGDG